MSETTKEHRDCLAKGFPFWNDLYAAGDCTGGLLQVAKAVYEGAQAGTEAAKALRKG